MVALVRLVLRYRRVHVYTVVEVGNLNSSTNFPVQFSSVSSWSPTLTPPPSQRTAPLPSVNTSTEYSLARATQFR